MFENIKKAFSKSADSVTWVFGQKTDTKSFKYSKMKGLDMYQKSLYLNKAINKRAEKVGDIKFVLKDLKDNEVENELTTLLDKPNEYQTKTQFFRLIQKFLDIYGCVYIHKDMGESILFNKNKDPKALHVLNPRNMELNTNDTDTIIESYTYSKGAGQNNYSIDEIIYLHNPNPENPIKPESIIYAGMRVLETNISADENQANSISTGGKIDTIIQAKGVSNSEQLQQIKTSYRNSKQESFDAVGGQEPFFAGGDIDVKRLALSPKDLEYIATKKMTIDDISIMTNVPVEILGVTSGATYSNAEASIRIFIQETIKPLQNQIIDVLNWRLVPDKFKLELIDPVPSNEEDKRKDLETADKIHAMTINEKREALGLPEVPNGDEIYIPFNLVSISDSPSDEKKKPKE